jgi:hypothetical protein
MDDIDNKSDSSDDYFESSIDKFNLYYLEDVIDIIYNLQEKFSINPFFLHHINTQLLIDFFNACSKFPYTNSFLYLEKHSIIYNYDYTYFLDECEEEIKISYDIISNFLKKFNYTCNLYYWKLFCFKYSEVNNI